MRTEQEMFELILAVAKADERIRAVYMNGSRANPNVDKDKYQDYDIVYVVTETESFLTDKSWISIFGDIAIVQEPDSNDLGWGQNADYSRSYCWLMLFKDGTRIDLHIQIKEVMYEEYMTDSLTLPLLDKDNILPPIPPPNDKGYWIQKPGKSSYDGCCNEFWWCLNNVAKGIVRDQLPYAMRMYHEVVHIELDKMLMWYIGIKTEFSVSVGMWGKYFKKYLPTEFYELYTKTYSDYENLWTAIFTACELFRTVAIEVGKSFGYEYNQSDDDNMMIYLIKMKNNEF
jgi:aminoglycoside 6-adenylyltransferase